MGKILRFKDNMIEEKWNTAEFETQLDESAFPELLKLMGEQGVVFARENLRINHSIVSGNLSDSICYSTNEFQSAPAGGTGKPIEKPNVPNAVNIGTSVVYSWIQEFGGKIQAIKILGSVSRKRDVWAMEQFFWHMWYQTEEEKWKWMALHMQKYDYVTIPAKPYLRPVLNRGAEIVQIAQLALDKIYGRSS
jgi:hypothetical protein